MITEKWWRAAFLIVAAAILLPIPMAHAVEEIFGFAYLMRQGDPRHAPHRAYTGLTLRDHKPAVDGAKAGIRESRVPGRAVGVKFQLREETLTPEQSVTEALERLANDHAVRAFILDLPLEDVKEAARNLTGREIFLFNVRHRDDVLRGSECSRVLFHTIPSNAMLMDALAQYLYKKNWTEVLVLEGETEADAILGAAFHASAKKFRLELVDTRPFVLSNDPRIRDQTNIALLTGSADYDVIFLADSVGEFGRYVPYQSKPARLVVGSEGLTPSAWHWTWERHGAPQLNQRFDRIAKRRMQGEDWAAWAAVRSVVQAILRAKSRDIAKLRPLLYRDDFTLDVYKGFPGNFRPWNNQLRQPILLHTHNAVVARAPIEGFLHKKNNLDTLGVDERESSCRFE